MMIKQYEKTFIKRLEDLYDKQEAKELFLMCAEEVLGISRIQLLLQQKIQVNEDQQADFDRLLSELVAGRPIQYVLGYAWFYDLKFFVNEAVLIPRPETEELVALISKAHQGESLKILDIGTGSGCIAIALKKNLPQAKIWAMDVSEDALKTAHQNAIYHDTTIHFIEQDILNVPAGLIREKLDVIVSNPPYIIPSEQVSMTKSVISHEPHLALFTPEEKPLMFYEAIAIFAKEYLSDGGKLYFEINRRFGLELKELLKMLGFNEVQIHVDMHGAERMISCTWNDH